MENTSTSESNVVERLLEAVKSTLDVDAVMLSAFGTDVRVEFAVGDAECLGMAVGSHEPHEESAPVAATQGRLPAIIADTRLGRTARRMLAERAQPVLAFASAPVHFPTGQLYGALHVAAGSARPELGAPDHVFLSAMAKAVSLQLASTSPSAKEWDKDHAELLRLLGGDEMKVVFQPIVRLSDGHTVGVEALSRFSPLPHRPPDVWFAAAARSGLGVAMEAAAVSRALAQLHRFPAHWYLAINASPELILSGVLTDLLEPIPGHRIVIEITEHVAIDDYPTLSKALRTMRERGVRLAVDDAGAGFASMRHVLRLEPDIIKLDGSVTRDCDTDIGHHALTATLSDFAIKVGATLLAEALETPDELASLKELGVPLAQGFLLASPGDPGDLRSEYPTSVPEAHPLASH